MGTKEVMAAWAWTTAPSLSWHCCEPPKCSQWQTMIAAVSVQTTCLYTILGKFQGVRCYVKTHDFQVPLQLRGILWPVWPIRHKCHLTKGASGNTRLSWPKRSASATCSWQDHRWQPGTSRHLVPERMMETKGGRDQRPNLAVSMLRWCHVAA
jgi:hypothetical protein